MLEGCSEQSFYSVTVTPTETSVVLPDSYLTTNLPDSVKVEDGWCTIRVEGPLDFSLIGILSKLATTLANVDVSIFVVSTFDTDYLLVKIKNLEVAKKALSEAGHDVFNLDQVDSPPDAAAKTAAAATATTAAITTTSAADADVAGFAPFALERYFARHEFSAPYLLSCSDIQPLSQAELLEMADDECAALWSNLSLGYTESQGLPLLRQEVTNLYNATPASEKGVQGNLSIDNVLVVAPEEGIYLACRALLSKGDTIIAPAPCYQSLAEVARAIGCTIVWWSPVENDDGYLSFHVDDLIKMIRSHQPKMCVLNFPHNPTGLMITNEEKMRIASVCHEGSSKCWLLSDEMYHGMEHDLSKRSSLSMLNITPFDDVDAPAAPAAAPAASAAPAENEEKPILLDNLVVLSGMSKLYGLAGLRIGWMVTRDVNLMNKMKHLRDYTTICNSAPSEILSLIGLRNHERLTKRSNEIIVNGLNAVTMFMSEFNDVFVWQPPTVGSISFPKLKGGISATKFADEIVRRVGVMLLPSSVYDCKEDDRLRLGFGRTNVEECLQVLKVVVRDVVEWCRE